MLRPVILGLAVAAILAGAGEARAQRRVNLELCADPDRTPIETINFCSRAILKEKLSEAEEVAALINRGAANFAEGRYGSAVRDYNEAEALDPGQFLIFANRAGAYARLGDPAAALDDYDAALAMQPDDRLSLLGRGGVYLAQGEGAKAFRDFDHAARLAPNDPDTLFNRGLAALQLKQLGQAESDFSRVIKLAPGDGEAHLYRARARLASDPKLAMRDFGRAITLAPEDARAWFERGRLHDSEGRIEKANRDFRRAFELGHPSSWLQERIHSLSN